MTRAFICTPSDLHPFECLGPGKCEHCDQKHTTEHDPNRCALCDDKDPNLNPEARRSG